MSNPVIQAGSTGTERSSYQATLSIGGVVVWTCQHAHRHNISATFSSGDDIGSMGCAAHMLRCVDGSLSMAHDEPGFVEGAGGDASARRMAWWWSRTVEPAIPHLRAILRHVEAGGTVESFERMERESAVKAPAPAAQEVANEEAVPVPESKQARERLGAWEKLATAREATSRKIINPSQDSVGGGRSWACVDGAWNVRDRAWRVISHGTATLGPHATLLLAAQAAADASPEARAIYEWEGQAPAHIAQGNGITRCDICQRVRWGAETDAAFIVAHEHCGILPIPVSEFAGVPFSDDEIDDMAAFANARRGMVNESSDRRDVIAALKSAGGAPTHWGRFIHDRARAIIAARTPTREEVEAACRALRATGKILASWEWLGWTEKEWWAYDREGTIPARPLRKHPPAYDGTICGDCDCNHDHRKTGKLVGCVCENDHHPWRKRVEAPKPPGWTILGSHAGDIRCATCGARHGTEPVIEFARAHEAHGREPAPPAVTIPRPGDEREKAIEALTGCEHSAAFASHCTACGATDYGRGMELPSLVAALVRS